MLLYYFDLEQFHWNYHFSRHVLDGLETDILKVDISFSGSEPVIPKQIKLMEQSSLGVMNKFKSIN
jgi:hypothetical protein